MMVVSFSGSVLFGPPVLNTTKHAVVSSTGAH